MQRLLELFALVGQMTGLNTESLTLDQTTPSNASLAYSPPFYPSPWMTGTGDWTEAYQQARDFVSQLTLLEKVNLTTGMFPQTH
jgi:beta-glucosidase